jgi:hypothetical protein
MATNREAQLGEEIGRTLADLTKQLKEYKTLTEDQQRKVRNLTYQATGTYGKRLFKDHLETFTDI